MDRTQAKRQIDLLALQCSHCKNVVPSYRIVIGKTKPQPKIPSLEEDSIKTPKSTSQQAKLQPNPQPPSSGQPIPFPLYCLTCLSKGTTIQQHEIHPVTYSQVANRYIKHIPLPDYALAEECLKLMGQIEEEAQGILKAFGDIMDNFKFWVLKLNADVQRMCRAYVQKLQYFQKLRVEEMLLLKLSEPQSMDSKEYNKIKTMFNINQSESINQLTHKYQQLRTVKSKLPQIKLTMPVFQSAQVPKRKRTQLTNIPISSMTSLNGHKYFGTADGRILYHNLDSLVSHPAHDSLIRSFSHDDQYTLYSGSDDFSIKSWNVRYGQLECLRSFGTLQENKSYHRNICVVEDGRKLVSTRGQFDNFRIRVWQLEDQYPNVGVLDGHDSFIRTMVVIDKDKDILITGSDDKTIKIWDLRQSRPIRTLLRTKKPQNIIVNPLFKLLCIIQQQNHIQILDLSDYQPITSATMPRKILCSCGYSLSICHEPINDYLVVCMPTSVNILRWDCIRVWWLDLEVSYVPVGVMQFGDGLILSDGSGVIDEICVGDVALADRTYFENLNAQE